MLERTHYQNKLKYQPERGQCMPMEITWWVETLKGRSKTSSYYIYYIHFKITGNPCNLTCSQWCNLFKESTMFCSKLHLFPSQWGHLNKMPQSIVWRNQSNCTKMKKKNWNFLQTSSLSDQQHICTDYKILYLSDWIVRFQNGCNKVVIELSVVQFWAKIILVFSNQISATHYFDFEITHMISDQTVLHWVQLPLFRVRILGKKPCK